MQITSCGFEVRGRKPRNHYVFFFAVFQRGTYAVKMLEEFPEVTKEETDRVCRLIGHHHTYTDVDGKDIQILLEADFLVNAYEDGLSPEGICAFREKVFRTKTGTELLDTMYGLNQK